MHLMRFNCEKKDLLAGINIVTKALSTRGTIPVLEGIYIETSGGMIKLKCSDLAMSIESHIISTIEEEGAVVLPGRLFSEMARRFPDGRLYFDCDSERSVKITCGHSKPTLQGMNASEFPQMPKLSETGAIEISQNGFKEMIRQTVFAVAADETKPILTGVLIEVEGDDVNLVALDGYRLAVRHEKLSKSYPSTQVVIPGRTLSEAAKIFLDEDSKISIYASKNQALIDMGFTRIATRLLEGDFIKYRQILPTEHATSVRVNRHELLDCIDRASLLAREGNNLVKMSVGEESILLTSNSELGAAHEEVGIKLEGKGLDIAFNAKYFSDVLKNLDDDEVSLEFNTNISPCVVKPVEGDKFTYLILPVRVYGG
jgi:DNA polymerase III subunit beta